MRILDRYIVRSFLFNYFLALTVLVGMYILFDLIVNFDNFTRSAAQTAAQMAADQANATAANVLGDIIDFYSYQILVIFQQVSGIIPLLAGGFTMVRMTRHNELTAMIASGVSLYRVAVPIIFVSIGLSLVLPILNQELIISRPYIVEKLLRKHDQVNMPVTRKDAVYSLRDEDNSLIFATEYDPDKKEMKDLRIIQRDLETSAIRSRIIADKAAWDETNGYWILTNAMQIDEQSEGDPTMRVAERVPTLIYNTRLTPKQLDLIFSKKAVDYLSSSQIRELAEQSPEINKPPLYKIMHLRFTQPLMNIIMLLIGIPFLLTRVPSQLIWNMAFCVVVSGAVFIGTFVIFQMSGSKLDPLLAAWLPVMLFGPVAVVMLDLIKT